MVFIWLQWHLSAASVSAMHQNSRSFVCFNCVQVSGLRSRQLLFACKTGSLDFRPTKQHSSWLLQRQLMKSFSSRRKTSEKLRLMQKLFEKLGDYCVVAILFVNCFRLLLCNIGEYGIICLEDIIHELVTVGPRFKEVNAYLLHFRLNTPAGGWKKRAKKFVDGGECGDRGDSINQLLQRMI